MSTENFVAWSGQPIDSLTDNVEFVRRIYQRTEKGNIIIASWAALHRGSIISQSGPEGKLVVPTTALVELPKIKEQYEEALGCLVNFGIGETLSEAIKAVAASLGQGAGKTVIYAAWMEEEKNNAPEETDPLLKSSQPHKGQPAPALKQETHIEHVVEQTGEPEVPSIDEDNTKAWDPKATGPDDIAQILHSYAKPAAEEEKPDLAALRDQTGNIIKQIKELVPAIEDLRSKFPELYQGYLLLVHAFVELNKQNPAETMQKSEKDERSEDEEDEAELVDVPLEHFKSEDFAPEDDKTSEYEKLTSEAPPVLMLNGKVVDGKKRLSVAKKQGKKTVKAYLGKTTNQFSLGRGLTKLPPGSEWQNRQKQINPETGMPRWKALASGMIMSSKTGLPVSSTRPE